VNKKTYSLKLTKSQIENLKEFFELEFINTVRNDTSIDNINYIVDMIDIYKKLEAENEKN